LLLLYELADTPADRAVIAEALGDVPEDLRKPQAEFDAAIKEMKDQMEDLISRIRTSPETRRRFADLAMDAITDAQVPPALLRLLEAWKRYSHIDEVRAVFDEAATMVERAGESIVGRAERRRSQPKPLPPQYRPYDPWAFARGDQPVYRVMITCPQTGMPVWTGVTTDEESWPEFELPFPVMRADCPHCRGFHDWKKEDAYLSKVI
jgi:hypothetical protein